MIARRCLSITTPQSPSLNNQTAHEVTRDVTAWAWLRVSLSGVRCRGGSCDPAAFWHRTDSLATCSRAWARLGPLSRGGAFDRGSSTDGVVATVSAATAHPTGWLGGIPTGRPWDFALRAFGPRWRMPEGKAARARSDPAKGVCASAANRGCDPSLPDPIPRICPTFAGRYQPAASSWVRRPGCRKAFPSRSEAPRAATVTRIAMGPFQGP